MTVTEFKHSNEGNYEYFNIKSVGFSHFILKKVVHCFVFIG